MRRSLRYLLSYRDLEEMMLECGLSVAHPTIYCLVIAYSSAFNQRFRQNLGSKTDLWRVDEGNGASIDSKKKKGSN